MKRTSWWPALLLFVVAGSAQAEDTARAHFERATTAFALGEYGQAATEYEAAFKLKSEPALLYNAAQSHRLGGNKVRALLLYQNYLRIYGDRIPNRTDVEAQVATLKQAIANEKTTTTTTAVKTTPPEPREPTVTTPTPTPVKTTPVVTVVAPAPRPSRPLGRSPALWGVLVGGLVVAGGAVTLGVVLGSPSSDPTATFGTIGVTGY